MVVGSTPQPYPSYKLSGVEWLGDVPGHWDLRRLGADIRHVVDLADARQDGDLYLALEHVESWTGNYGSADDDEHFESSVKRFQPGDILFGKLRPYLAKVASPNKAGVCVSEFMVLRPDEAICTGFMARLLRSKPVIDAIDSSTFGAKMPRAEWAFVKAMPIPLPPLSEQRAIVRYLDFVDERIRRFVDAKRRLVTLLEEERQAVINHAVTRGLDPDVPLRPSGVEWLGDIPEHWEVRRLKTVGQGINGLAYRAPDVVDAGSGTLVLRASNVNGSKIVFGDDVYVDCAVPEKLLTRSGDILICSNSGSRSLVGKNATINPESSGLTFGVFMTVFRSRHNHYLRHVFNSKLFEFHAGSFMSSTINQLTLSVLGSMQIPLPPFVEQQAIVKRIDAETSRIDADIARARRQIELVEEYRTRLIADVVTGQLDVLEVAALMPEPEAIASAA